MQRKLKILFVIDKLDRGGTECQLIELMKRLDPEKFELYLGCLAGPASNICTYLPKDVRAKTVILEVRSTYSVDALMGIYRLIRFIRSESIDIVQCYFLRAKFLGSIAGRLAGATVVSCQRDLGLHINFKNLWPLKFANSCADRFLVNSLSVRSYLIENLRIHPDRIDVIPNGVDLGELRPATPKEKAENKIKLGIDPVAIVIGVVANLRPVKGLGDFIRAASLVCQVYEKVQFVIVGEGAQEKELRGFAAELRVENKIVFAGGHEDVRPFLQAFDIAVLSSYSEGLSNAILEYMASGLPVVATRIGGNVEQVQDGTTGFLVPPGDSESLAKAIIRLVKEDDLRVRMSENALRTCRERYGMDKMIKRMENYYFRLCTSIPTTFA